MNIFHKYVKYINGDFMRIKELVNNINTEDYLNARLFFTEKRKSEYNSFCPNTDSSVKTVILKLLLNELKNSWIIL